MYIFISYLFLIYLMINLFFESYRAEWENNEFIMNWEGFYSGICITGLKLSINYLFNDGILSGQIFSPKSPGWKPQN
jgi:hypothetical protein